MNPLSSSSLNLERTRLDAARTAAATESSGTQGTAVGGGFASLLKGAQATPAVGPTLPDTAAKPPPAVAQSSLRTQAEQTGRQQAARATLEAREAQRQGQQHVDTRRAEATAAQRKAEAPDQAAPSDEADGAASASQATVPGDTLAQWLLGQGVNMAQPGGANLPPPENPAPGSDDLQAAALAREVLDAVRGRAKAATAADGKTVSAKDEAAQQKAQGLGAQEQRSGAPVEVSAQGELAAQAAAEPKAATERRTQAGEQDFAQALGTAQAAAGNTPSALPSETAVAVSPSERVIETPTHHPAFGEAVGVSISRLARDGVQEASLQLNPAELGPVSVRIAMQGSEARIELGAALADTRALLDASMPALAEAMRADGLVLAGSQVSEWRGPDDASAGTPSAATHPYGGNGEPMAGGGQGGTGGQGRGTQERSPAVANLQMAWPGQGGGSTSPAPATRRSGLGGLDLYA